MALPVKRSPIYFNTKLLDRSLEEIPVETRGPQLIGDLWSRIWANDPINTPEAREKIVPLLEKLGVTKTDVQAHADLIPMIQATFGNDLEIDTAEDSGVFYLSRGGNKFAVFKVGEKRARMELLARHIAHKIGLEKHAIPGLFCSLARPIFPGSEIVVELWNGNQKVFRKESQEIPYTQSVRDDNLGVKQPYTLTGILEPYIASKEESTPNDFAKMTAYALFIGLRDGKLDGISGSMIFDAEDCMPARLLPTTSPNKSVAATHLPYLEDDRAKQPIDRQILLELGKKVDESTLPLFPFLIDLSNQKVLYPDLASESLEAVDKELHRAKEYALSGKDQAWDDGGCYIQVEETPKIIKDQHTAREFDIMRPETFRLLNDSQLNACATRITRLRDCLNKHIDEDLLLTSVGMVRAVDSQYNAHLNALEREKYTRQSRYSVAGRFSPHESKSNLSDADKQSLLEERLSTPSPPDLRAPTASRRLFDFQDASAAAGSSPPSLLGKNPDD